MPVGRQLNESLWVGGIINFLFINVNQNTRVDSSDSIPLSMGYILGYLRSLGHEGVILDDLLERPLSLRTLEAWIEKLAPEVVGFTAYQVSMEKIGRAHV